MKKAAASRHSSAAIAGRDVEFESLVSAIKPLVKRLPGKTGRQSAVKWIRKMRDEAAKPDQSGVCHTYARELLRLLSTGHLAPPFNSSPPTGRLPALQMQPLHDDSLSMLEDDSFHADVMSMQRHTEPLTANQHSIPGGSGSQFPLRAATSTAVSTNYSAQPYLPWQRSTSPDHPLPPQANGFHSRHGEGMTSYLASMTSSQGMQDRGQPVAVSSASQSQSAPLSTYAPPTNISHLLASSSSSSSSSSTSTMPDVDGGSSQFVSRAPRVSTAQPHFVHTSAAAAASTAVGIDHAAISVTGSRASSVLDAADIFSSDDESLERLLAAARPPPDADVESLLDDSDDSVENLLASMPLSSLARPAPAPVSAAHSSIPSPVHPVATSAVAGAPLTSSAALGTHNLKALRHSSQYMASSSSRSVSASASPSPSLKASHLSADVHQSLRYTQLELEKLRVVQRAQSAQSEMTVSRLKEQVHQLEQDLAATRQEASTSLDRLRAKHRSKTKSLEEDWHRKVSEVMASCESDKLALQQNQTAGMQQLLQETEQRLGKVHAEHGHKSAALSQTSAMLEAKVAQLSEESEQANIRHVKLLQDKSSLSSQLNAAQSEAEQLSSQCRKLERQRLADEESHQALLDELRQTTEETLQQTQASAGNIQEELQQNVQTLRLDLNMARELLTTTQHQHHMQLQEIHSQTQVDQQRLVSKHEQEMNKTRADLEQGLRDSHSQLQICNSALSDKESTLRQVEAECTAVREEAHLTLEQFKQSVEQTSAKAHVDMKEQVSAIKRDLEQSKSMRQQQAKEFRHQNELLQQQHQSEVMKLRAAFEREKAILIEDHRQQVTHYQQERDRERDSSMSRLRETIADHEIQIQQLGQKDAAVIKDLEAQLHQTQEELLQVTTRHKAQLLELTHTQVDNKERSSRELDHTITRLRSEMTQLRHQLQQEHSAEIDELLAKTNIRLQQIEADYTGKVSSMGKASQRLQRDLRQARAELQQAHEQNTQEVEKGESRHAEAMIAVRQQHDSALQSVQQEVDLQRNRVHHLEKKIRHRSLHEEEKVAKLHQQFEDRIKGLLPEAVRNDLEDTITSVKRQVETLEQHTALLQRQLDSRNRTQAAHAIPSASPTKHAAPLTPSAKLPTFRQLDSSDLGDHHRRRSASWRATDVMARTPMTSTPKALN